MNEKRVKRVMLGATLVIGGILAFGVVRRKKLLYKSIQDTINDVAGNTSNPFGQGSSGAGCSAPSTTIDRYANQIKDAVEIVSIFEGTTDEDAILQTIAEIQTKACMTRTANRYQQLYSENMNQRIRSELSGTDLQNYETAIDNLR